MADKEESALKIVLADFGDWSKPVNTLIEKCADAIGGLAEPYQIARIAQAHAKADEIAAISDIKISKLQRRAAARFIAEETKKQLNMETIIRGALPDVTEAATPDKMDDDWIMNFFDKCRLVSDEKMQKIWSKVLAGEANSAGQFSKRTVTLVGSLDKFEVDLFSTLCRFLVTIEDREAVVIMNETDPIYNQFQIGYGSLFHLADIGLIQFTAIGNLQWGMQRTNRLYYFGQPLELAFPEGHPRTMTVGKVGLSLSGLQLLRLVQAEPVSGFIEYLAEFWKRYGITMTRL